MIPPVYVEVTEVYNLGKVTRTYTNGLGVQFADHDIDVFVTYRKTAPGNNSQFRLGEHVSFRDQYNRHHDYFSDHEIYGGAFSKWTRHNGRIVRKMRPRFSPMSRMPIDLSKWDQDILDIFEELPPYVMDVIGIDKFQRLMQSK